MLPAIEGVLDGRNPTDPFADFPELGADLRKALGTRTPD